MLHKSYFSWYYDRTDVFSVCNMSVFSYNDVIQMTVKKNNLTMGILLVFSFLVLFIVAGEPPEEFPSSSSLPPPPPEAIDSISPSYADPGSTFVLTVILKEGFEPPSELQITSVTIGNISGKNIERDTLNRLKIKAEFTIPPSETPAFKDLSVIFPGPFKRNITLLRPSFFQVRKNVR